MADLDTGPNSYIRIPPDGAGKRMVTGVYLAIDYKNGVTDFVVDDEITAPGNNFVGTVIALRPGNLTASGTIYVNPSITSTVQDVTPNDDLNVNATKYAEVTTSIPFYPPGHIVLGANNPTFGQRVDRNGSAFVRFTDGSQQLSAFGASKVAPSEQLAAYTFHYDMDSTEWSHEVSGTAPAVDVTHLPDESSIALDIGIDSGDMVRSTTDRYHIYQPGFGQLIEMTVTCGDNGKAGLRRRWGYFDDFNGLYFEQLGADLCVVQRSNTSGSVIETRVLQGSWGEDKLDGSRDEANASNVLLDVTNVNIYWIDFAWLGAGRVRFGIFSPAGERILIHDFHNPNSLDRPYMTSGTLPIRLEIENITPVVSPSRLKLTCAQVEVEGKIVPTLERRSVKWTVKSAGTFSGEAFAASWRPTLAINGIRNNKTIVPESLRCFVTGQACHIQMYTFSTVTGGVWSQIDIDNAGDVNLTGTFGGGYLIYDWYLAPGGHNLPMPPNFNLLGTAGRLNADDSQDNLTITMESLEPTAGDTTVKFSFTGIDI
tara:strand:+ start:36131 stop:37750 length:1620 start_codon:yes stop_codon:yes gene_type:complete